MIGQEIAEFEQSTGLTLRVGMITEPDHGTLLDNAKNRAAALGDGYYILIGTELRQHINDQKPTIAVGPSRSQFGELDRSDYDQIIAAFQPQKQVALQNAIIASIDTLQAEVLAKQRADTIVSIIGHIIRFILFIGVIIIIGIFIIAVINSIRSGGSGGSGGFYGGGGGGCGGGGCGGGGGGCGGGCGSGS